MGCRWEGDSDYQSIFKYNLIVPALKNETVSTNYLLKSTSVDCCKKLNLRDLYKMPNSLEVDQPLSKHFLEMFCPECFDFSTRVAVKLS